MLCDKLRPNITIYGPYRRKKDQREILILYHNKNKQTISYPKWIMEQHLGRFLTEDETIDHIDRNFHNNEINNLQILPRSKHARLDATRRKETSAICALHGCGKEFILKRGQNNGKAGPFCSKICTGKYGASVQNGGEILPPHKIKFEHYQQKKTPD